MLSQRRSTWVHRCGQARWRALSRLASTLHLPGTPSPLTPCPPTTPTAAEYCCNGTVIEDEELGKVLQLQGDQRKVRTWQCHSA